MKTHNLLHKSILQLALAGCLLAPFTLVPCHADAASSAAHSAASTPSANTDEYTISQDDNDDVGQKIEAAMSHIGPLLDDTISKGDKDYRFRPELLVPLFAIAFIFGGPIILIIVLAALMYRNRAQRLKNINGNIERLLAAGRDIPIELLRGDEPLQLNAQSNRNHGIRNIGMGVGLFIAVTPLCGFDVGALAFILIGLGISQLVIWKLSARAENPAAQKTTDISG